MLFTFANTIPHKNAEMNKLLDDESDLFGSDDKNLFKNAEYDREEDIYLRDSYYSTKYLPKKWSFQSFSERGGTYIGDMKTRVSPNLLSFGYIICLMTY